jgi:hypothetical protein
VRLFLLAFLVESPQGVVALRQVGHDGELVGSALDDVFGVQEFGDARLVLAHLKGQFEIL